MISADGFFAGTDGDISWHNVDAEFNEFAIDQLSNEAGMLMFGRITYDLMASYWPLEEMLKDDPIVAGLMNGAEKIVFSKSMDKAAWNNTKIIKEINPEEIWKMKQGEGKDIFIFGSGQIAQEFTKLGLIDEYRLIINPVVLGAGKPLFADPFKLKLLKFREFKNGNVLVYYKVS